MLYFLLCAPFLKKVFFTWSLIPCLDFTLYLLYVDDRKKIIQFEDETMGFTKKLLWGMNHNLYQSYPLFQSVYWLEINHSKNNDNLLDFIHGDTTLSPQPRLGRETSETATKKFYKGSKIPRERKKVFTFTLRMRVIKWKQDKLEIFPISALFW